MIELATFHDAEAINRIYNQAVQLGGCTADTEPISIEQRLAWLSEHAECGLPVFVFREADRVQGWCSLSPYRKGRQALATCAEISYYVDESQQGRGIGRKLTVHALEWSRHTGLQTLVAFLIDGNEKSIGLLVSLGFAEWGRIRSAYQWQGTVRDHLLYGRNLAENKAEPRVFG
ncbi:MAG TPA: N-acetyltransferase family protein [Acidobacteriota bacterium]|nr:N-acetyltransferase family protein [Acidobacteriota bacterium]